MALTKISRSLLDTGISDSSDATAITITSDEDFLVRQTSADVYDTNSGGSVRQYWGNQFSAQNNTNSRVIIGSASNSGLVGGATVNSGGTKPIVNSYMSFTSVDQTAGGEDGIIAFYTSSGGAAGTEKMRIDSSGNVGIGRTPGNYSGLSFSAPILDTAGILQTRAGGINLGGATYRKAAIFSPTADADAGYMQFYVGESGNTDTAALQWQITQYGTFAPNGNNAKNIGDTSNRVSVIYTSNAVNVSDQTLKTEIEDCDLGLDFINTLQPKSYKNLQSVGVALQEGHDDYNRKHYGLIAQDLKGGSLNDSVYGTKDGEYSLAYNDLIAPIIKAIQEQQAQIEALQSEINTLKGE